MDLKVVATAFVAVFFAELADKTQLVGIGLSAKTAKPLSVFLGSVAAYTVITGVSVLAGALLGKHLNPLYLRYAGGLLFIALGALMLTGHL